MLSGTVVSVLKDSFVARVDKPRKVGSRVFDSGKRFLGKVLGTFGPVEKPFVEVGLEGPRKPSVDEKVFW